MDHSSFFLEILNHQDIFSHMIGVTATGHYEIEKHVLGKWPWVCSFVEVIGSPLLPPITVVLSSQLWHQPLSPPWFLPGAVGWTPLPSVDWRILSWENIRPALNGDYTGCVWTTSYFRVLVEGGSNKRHHLSIFRCSSALKDAFSPFSDERT